jgi:zinc D-Ala-D-Ala carboxypeptidase
MNFSKIQYFQPRELESPDAPGSGENMKLPTVLLLDKLREACGFPLIIASGYRTERHNQRVGGVDSSSHTAGWAVDVRATSSDSRWKIVKYAIELGFNRIGIASTFVHLDCSPEHPENRIWTY